MWVAVTLFIDLPGDTSVVFKDRTPHSVFTSHDITSEEQQEIQVKTYFSSNFTKWGLHSLIFSMKMATEVCWQLLILNITRLQFARPLLKALLSMHTKSPP